MDRATCERLIAEKLSEIVDIYHQYNADGTFLSLNYNEDEDGHFEWFYNRYWGEGKEPDGNAITEAGEDFDRPVNYFRNLRKEGVEV